MNETIGILVKFKIGGNLRFLSHAEMVMVIQRACSRAGVKLRYSQGFNPHPKMSLPLPRSVGTESDDELLCLKVEAEGFDVEDFKIRFCEQLPEGCDILSVEVAEGKVSFQPRAATYVFAVQREYLNEALSDKIEGLLASKSLNLQRRIDDKGSMRNVEVRGFLKSMELDGNNVVVECEISPAGSIRINEILELLELDTEKLTAPVKRASVQWQEV